MSEISAAILGAAMICMSAHQTFAIQGLQISVQCPNILLSWPSTEGDAYIIRYRPSLDASTPWTNLADAYPADSGTNITVFVLSNIVQCSSGGGTNSAGGDSGPPPAPGTMTESTSTTIASSEPLVMRADGSSSAVPIMLYPPGFNLTGFLILDPITGEWMNGAGRTIAPLAPQTLDGPQPLDGGSGTGPDPGFYEVVKVGATLYGLTNGMTVSDTVSLPVEVGQTAGQLATVTLEDSGVPIASSIHVAPFELPVPQLVLDTTLLSNGVHNISVHAQWTDPGDGTEDGSAAIYEAYSPAFSVTVSNEISFPNWISEFGEFGNSLVVSAQSAHAPADWYLDVYDSQSNYVGTLGGTTTNGEIYIVWDLVGPPPENRLYTDNTFAFVLTTVYNDPVQTSKAVPPIYRVTDPWNGPGDWVVVNQQAWNNYVGSDELDTMTDGFAQMAQGLGLTVRPSAANGTAYRLHFGSGDPQGDTDWANFRSALYNNLSRNLFYLGHGSPAGLGYNQNTTNRSILATEIATRLATIPAGLTNKHKYRFVCLDGCSTASGKLPESFGIIHKENVNGGYYADASLRPSAFAGWNKDTAAGFFNSVINVGHVHFFQHFQYQWLIGDGVHDAFIHAAGYPDVYNIDTTQMKVFGFWELGVNAYNR